MISSWLDFLQIHHFIDNTQRLQRLRRLSDLAKPLLNIFKQHEDSALYDGIRTWQTRIQEELVTDKRG